MTTAADLLALKKRIEEVKLNRAKWEGEIRSIEKQMKEEFGTSDPKELEKKIRALDAQAESLKAKVDKGVAEIERELG